MSVNDPTRRQATDEQTSFNWNEVSEEAARLVAECRLGFPAIARRLGVARETIWRWRKHPEFQARVDAIHAEQMADLRRFGHLDSTRRIKNLSTRYAQLHEIAEERAESDFDEHYNKGGGFPTYFPKPPGYDTGLLLVNREINPRGMVSLKIQLDKALIDAMLELDKRLAQYNGEEWAVRSNARSQVDDDDPIIDEGTRHTMTPKERLEKLVSLMKDDPEYRSIVQDIMEGQE